MIEVSRELLAFLRSEYDRCRDDTLEDERATAIDFYNGEPFGDEEDGRSQLVTRDVAEVIDYMVISILRTLVSGDKVVEFVHKQKDKAQEATETIQHLFMEEQNGYIVLHDWLKAGLLEKSGVAMTYPEARPPKRRLLEGVDSDALALAMEQGAPIIEAEEADDGTFNITVAEPQPPKFCDAAIPNEEFYCSPDARSIDEAQLKGRRVRKIVSELVEMGFDADELSMVGDEFSANGLASEARNEDRASHWDDRTGPNRVLWLQEEFARFDENGDGVAELLFIQRVGDKVLRIDEMENVEDHPFEDWCPFPMPHRRIGQSLADKVMDIQRTRSVVLRQTMDGFYFANNPRTYIHEDSIGDATIDDLLTVRPGSLVRWKGQAKPEAHSSSFDISSGLAMLEQMNGERESRTGITRLNQGLDADALNKTATGTALMQAQGQQVEEYLARNFVNAVCRLFTKKARLLKRYGQPMEIVIDGEVKQVDPTQWPDDMIARPKVGLGSGRKDQRLIYRQQIMEVQSLLMQAGSPLVDDEKIFNSVKGAVADMGLGTATDFVNDPATLQPQPEKPDPEMAKAEAEMQIKAADLQGKQQEMAAKLEMQREEAALKLELERARAEAEMALSRERMFAEMELERERMRLQAEADERQAERDREIALKENRAGGALNK
jgi:hypothetical protein